MNYKESIEWLYGRIGIKYGLDRIKELLDKLGNPQLSYPTIHIGGTNGKGSTCAYLAAILKEAGYKVGLFTSPHLVDFEERIQINGELIPKRKVASLLTKIKPLVGEQSYFEINAALAFEYFKHEKVDIAVIEVAMGGRYDATNLIKPLISVITNVDFDHTNYLGKTIKKIASEKAGIIKEGSLVVTGADKGLDVIKKECRKKKCKLYVVRKKVKSSLIGKFQEDNLAIALKVIELLDKKGYEISKSEIMKGIKKTRWPARMQFVKKNLLFDCAHNPAGMKVLGEELKRLKKGKIYFVFGVKEDKDIKNMTGYVDKIADLFIITRGSIVPSKNPEEIAQHIRNVNKIIIEEPEHAVRYALSKANKNDLVVVAGSIYLIGEIFGKMKIKPFRQKICIKQKSF